MSEPISTKPYMVRAIHEWCIDNGFTPHLLVVVDSQTRVPRAHVKEGEIVLNLNYAATKDLHIDNEAIVFSARFGGVSQNLYVPMDAVKGIFARENGQGMFFEPTPQANIGEGVTQPLAVQPILEVVSVEAESSMTPQNKPTLTIVK
jgi:stringent starvation protein B